MLRLVEREKDYEIRIVPMYYILYFSQTKYLGLRFSHNIFRRQGLSTTIISVVISISMLILFFNLFLLPRNPLGELCRERRVVDSAIHRGT